MERNCDNCGEKYTADDRNVKRGWGLTCSKSCAASKREKSKKSYSPAKVAKNNLRRSNWNGSDSKYVKRTAEGYEVRDGIAYNEYGEKVYQIDQFEDSHDHGQWND